MKNLFITGLFFFLLTSAYSQSFNDYRTRQSGNWNVATTWEVYVSVFGWIDATNTPTSGSGAIEIRPGHAITVTANVMVDQVTVNGVLIINAGVTVTSGLAATMLTVTPGAGVMTVNGALTKSTVGTINTTTANTQFGSGASYNHNIQGSVIPLATWNSNANCNINLTVNNPAPPGNLNQTFGNVNISVTSNGGGGIPNFGFSNATSIAGTLSISTTRGLTLTNAPLTLPVGGNFVYLGAGNSSTLTLTSTGSAIITVGGSYIQSGGTLAFGPTGANSTLNINGDFTFSGGTIGNNVSNTGNFNFTRSGIQVYSRTGGTYTNNANRPINFDVAATSVLDAGVSTFTGTGTFTLNGTLRTGAAGGVGATNGTLQNTGVKIFNANSTIVYNGTVAQVMGPLYPGAPAAGINVVINNAAGVTTSALTLPAATTVTRVTGNLNLQLGTLNVGNAHTLQLEGNVSAIAGSISLNTPGNGNLVINGTGNLFANPFPFSGNQVFANLTLNRSGATVALANNVTLNGSLNLDVGTLFIGATELSCNGPVSITGGLVGGSNQSTLTIGGAGTVDVITFDAGSNVLNTLNINRGASVVSFGGDFTLTNELNVINGTLSAGATTITMQGLTWSVDGLSGGSFDEGTGTVVFDGSTAVVYSTNFHDIALTSTADLTFPIAEIFVSGNIDFASGGIFDANGGSVVMNAVDDQSVNSNGSEFYTLQVDKAGGDVTILSSLPVQHLLDIQSATQVNTQGNLIILSRGRTTDLDGAIGPILNGGVVNGAVTVQRFMHPLGSTWRYMASPVFNSLRPVEWGNSVYTYRYVNGTGGWAKYPVSSPLALGTGYAPLVPNSVGDVTWNVSGAVYQGEYTWTITTQGWHLLGNPYPSAIRWYEDPDAWELNNISTLIGVTDNSVTGYPNYFRYWSWDPADFPTEWGDGPLESGVLAMGQGFWVYAGEGGGTLTLKEPGKAVEGDGMFYRKKSTRTVSENLMITLDNGAYADRALLRLTPGATEHFEMQQDAMKLWNEEMNVFLVDAENNSLLIHALEDISEDMKIFLGIDVHTAGEYTLTLKSSDFRYATSLYLVDKLEGIVVSVSDGGPYRFSISDASQPITDRFYLTRNAEVSPRTIADRIQTYPNPVTDILTIQLPANQKATIIMHDGKGSVLLQASMEEKYELDFRDYPRGLYILKLLTEDGMVVRKIQK